jgi:hypothetical protein
VVVKRKPLLLPVMRSGRPQAVGVATLGSGGAGSVFAGVGGEGSAFGKALAGASFAMEGSGCADAGAATSVAGATSGVVQFVVSKASKILASARLAERYMTSHAECL